MGKRKTMTTTAGAPVCDNQNSLTAGVAGGLGYEGMAILKLEVLAGAPK